MQRVPSLFLVLALSVCACGAKREPQTSGDPSQPGGRAAAPRPTTSDTRIVAFSVSNENLRVDKVGIRDGVYKADGTLDLAFTATVEGPFEAVFVYSCNAKGEPIYGLRADTLTRGEEIPPELGSVVDTGKMTYGVGVFENGRLVNQESGRVQLESGTHALTLYTPNPGMLKAGDHVRLWVKAPNGALVASPVALY